MTDATTRQHARPHLDADPLEVALAAWRRGQPCDLPTLTRAGAISIGQAHEAWRAGLWESEECETCKGAGGFTFSAQFEDAGLSVVDWQEGCDACIRTGLQWSERHAELLDLAGEPGLGALGWGEDRRPSCASDFAVTARTWSDLATLAAAWGVAREWSRQREGGSGVVRGADRAALEAVWCYLCDPSEGALRGLSWGPDANPPNRLAVSATGLAGDVEAWSLGAIIRDAASDLGEEATSQAAREGVRRWAGRVWGVEP